MAKNDSEFYRADLAHSVNVLGSAWRALVRMNAPEQEGVRIVLSILEAKLAEVRRLEREAKQS